MPVPYRFLNGNCSDENSCHITSFGMKPFDVFWCAQCLQQNVAGLS